ncbi:MAG: DUF3352 domain-containing protein [Leptolyngbyaceae cyanobacterium]
MQYPWFLGVLGAMALPLWASPALADTLDPATQLPEDTAYVVLFDTRPETWDRLNRYAFFQIATADSGETPDLGGLAFLPNDLDYQATIAPWVGDTVAVAVLPLPRAQPTILEEHMVMVAPIANEAAFTGFTAEIEAAREATPEIQRYQEVEVLYWQPVYAEETEDTEEPEIPEAEDLKKIAPSLSPQNFNPFQHSQVPNWLSALGNPDRTKALPEVELPDPAPAEAPPQLEQPGLAIAVLPDTFVAAESPAAIRRWLDQRPRDSADSLAVRPRFQRTVNNVNYDRALGALYGNLSEIVKYALVESALDDLLFQIPLPPLLDDISAEDLAQLAALELDSTIEAYVYPQREGLRFQGRLYYDDSILRSLVTPPPPATDASLAFVPSATYLMINGRNLAGVWEQVTAVLDLDESTDTLLAQGRLFVQALTGLDLDEDIFGWMDGDFAFFLFPTPDTPLTEFDPGLQVGLGLAIQTSDRATAEATFKQLDQRLGTTFFSVEPLSINEQAASSWELDLGSGVPTHFLAHGWAEQDDIAVITTSGPSLNHVLNLSERQSLQDAVWFQRATRGFPEANQGYFYTNISSSLSLISNAFELGAEASETIDEIPSIDLGQQLLGTVQTISVTASFTPEAMQLDALVMLSPMDP